MTRLTLREASRLISSRSSATAPGTGATLMLVPKANPDPTPVLEAQIAALRVVSELLRAQLTDTREECDRLRQKAEQLALPPPAPVPVPPRRRHRRRWWQPAW